MFHVVADLLRGVSHMQSWYVEDLTVGLDALQLSHEATDTADRLPGKPIDVAQHPGLLEQFRREVHFARAAYAIPDVDKMVKEAQGPLDAPAERPAGRTRKDVDSDTLRIVAMETTSERRKPAFYVALDKRARLVRVVVRGTKVPADVLTDIAGHVEEYAGGHAHCGFLDSAKWLLAQVSLLIAALLEEYPNYGIRFSGHSLGAATAALATHMLRSCHVTGAHAPLAARRPTCYALSSPPVLSRALAVAAAPYVTTLVVDHDIVARASLANFERLRQEVVTTERADIVTACASRVGTELACFAAKELSTWTRPNNRKRPRVAAKRQADGAGIAVQSTATSSTTTTTIAGTPDSGAGLTQAVLGLAMSYCYSVVQPPKVLEDLGISRKRKRGSGGAPRQEEEAPKKAVQLYAPGRLYQLQRAERNVREQRWTLVKGSPVKARFEFIAMRSTSVSDHGLATMLGCLDEL